MRFNFGNRCGHNPMKPRVYKPPQQHGSRPDFLVQAGKRMQDAYHHRYKYHFGLRLFLNTQKKSQKTGLFRQRRSEFAEAIATRVGLYICHHVNLAEMVLGWYVDKTNEFQFFGYEDIAKATRIPLHRVKRAMSDLIAKGYVYVKQRKETEDRVIYRSLKPRIRISMQLFIDLGFPPDYVEQKIGEAKLELEKNIQFAMDRYKHVAQPQRLFVPDVFKEAPNTEHRARIMALKDLLKPDDPGDPYRRRR